jgi:hypothetical protein
MKDQPSAGFVKIYVRNEEAQAGRVAHGSVCCFAPYYPFGYQCPYQIGALLKFLLGNVIRFQSVIFIQNLVNFLFQFNGHN